MMQRAFPILYAAILACAAAPPAAASDVLVEVKLVVKDRLTNASVSAAVYSFKTCKPPTSVLTCNAIDVYDARSPHLKMKCSKGEMLFARLSVTGYVEQSTSAICSSVTEPIVLLATKNADPGWLMKAGNELLNLGKPAEATVLINEAYAQKPTPANREAALLAAARALNVSKGEALMFDRQQQKNVPTITFVNAIKEFQRRNNLPDDGVLGSRTIGALVNSGSSGEAIRKLATQQMSDGWS